MKFSAKKAVLILMMFVYTVLLVDFTLIDDSYGRNISNIFLLGRGQAIDYIKNNTNIIPFKTILLFLNGFKTGALSLSAVLENILGNFLVFMPYALFVPFVLPKINNVFKFFCFVSVFVVTIEVLQLLFVTGAADIDDYLLNVLGALAAYEILRKESIQRFIKGAVRI